MTSFPESSSTAADSDFHSDDVIILPEQEEQLPEVHVGKITNVIGHVTIPLDIGHFLLVVLWKRDSNLQPHGKATSGDDVILLPEQ